VWIQLEQPLVARQGLHGDPPGTALDAGHLHGGRDVGMELLDSIDLRDRGERRLYLGAGRCKDSHAERQMRSHRSS
jgi:hypothetical protein